jgi:hypothetical protein
MLGVRVSKYITKSIRYDVYSALLRYCSSKSITSFNECLEYVVRELCNECLEHVRWEIEFHRKLSLAKDDDEKAEIIYNEIMSIVEKYKKSIDEYKELVSDMKKRVIDVITKAKTNN